MYERGKDSLGRVENEGKDQLRKENISFEQPRKDGRMHIEEEGCV